MAKAQGSLQGWLALSAIGAGMLGVGLVWHVRIEVAQMLLEPMPLLGGLLFVGGLVLAATRLRAEPEPEPAVPAHVAFLTRTPRVLQAPPAYERPAPVAVEAPDAEELRRRGIEEEIRDLSRQISRAGVMLATGKLSEEGYKHYVDELKGRRAKLEADRLGIELRR